MQQNVTSCWNRQIQQHKELHWLMMRSWRWEASRWRKSSQNLCILSLLVER